MQIKDGNCLDGTDWQGPTTMGQASGCATELLLLREMTHRINNELTSVIGFISGVAARSTNRGAKLALGEVVEQLHDCARLHRFLQMPTENRLINATTYLRGLCRAVSRAKLQSRRIELVLIEHPIQLSSLQCWRLGMIVSELITNSYRHAFGESGGTIRVELKRCGSHVECRVEDDGACSDSVRAGHGLGIVRQLARMLDGEIYLSFGQDGAAALVSFPVLKQVQHGRPLAEGL
jgi:two-component sensor histidine kinase